MLTEPSVTMCERTMWCVQKAPLCLFSVSSSVSVFFFSVLACVCKYYKVILNCPHMSLKHLSWIHLSTRQDLIFMNQYHESCLAYQVSLFFVIAFTTIGLTNSYCPAQDVAHHRLKQGTDQNKRPHVFLHRPISQDASQTDVQGLSHPSGSTQALVLFVNLLYSHENVKYF